MTKTATERLAQLKSQLRICNKHLTAIRKEVQEERDKGPDFAGELAERASEAQISLALIKKKISTAKGLIKKRKSEINEWKLWFTGINQVDKSAELQQLNEEIAWRATEIASQEAMVTGLYVDGLQAEGELEQAQTRLEALKEVNWDVPIKDDPRIKHLTAERDRLKASLDSQK